MSMKRMIIMRREGTADAKELIILLSRFYLRNVARRDDDDMKGFPLFN